MIAMHAGQQNHVNLAEPRILGPGHCKARVEQKTRAIRILEQHGAVATAELSVMAADRCDFDVDRPVNRLGGGSWLSC